MANRDIFVWSVSKGQYKWVDLDGESFLIDGSRERSGKAKEYSPLKDAPGLFLDFARLEPDRQHIHAFANRWGLLGIGMDLDPRRTGNTRPNARMKGERLEDWKRESARLGAAVDLWLAAGLGARTVVNDLILWFTRQKAAQTQIDRPRLPADAIPETASSQAFWNAPAGHTELEVARSLLSATVNDRLRHLVSPRLEYRTASGRTMDLAIVPDNLLGALWLELGLALSENSQFRRCRTCGRWFEIRANSYHPDQQFCSAKCRSRAYYERQETARRLWSEGIPLEVIVERLQTDAQTAEGWVKRRT